MCSYGRLLRFVVYLSVYCRSFPTHGCYFHGESVSVMYGCVLYSISKFPLETFKSHSLKIQYVFLDDIHISFVFFYLIILFLNLEPVLFLVPIRFEFEKMGLVCFFFFSFSFFSFSYGLLIWFVSLLIVGVLNWHAVCVVALINLPTVLICPNITTVHSLRICSFPACCVGLRSAKLKDHYRHVHQGFRYVCFACDARFSWRNTVNTHINNTTCKGSRYEVRYFDVFDNTKPKSDVSKPLMRVPKRANAEFIAGAVANKSPKMILQPTGMDFATALSVIGEGSARLLTKQAVSGICSTAAVVGKASVPMVASGVLDVPHCSVTSKIRG